MATDEAAPEARSVEPFGAAPAADYTIGYGRPPVATRFRPGQSGNPRGARKGAPQSPRSSPPRSASGSR